MEVVKIRPLITMLTPLRDIPRTWLRLVEPKIERPKDQTCWLWKGCTDMTGNPIVSLKNPITKKRTNTRASRIVAALFYNLKTHHEVIHRCGNLNCLNPAHLYVSARHYTQEDRPGMVKAMRHDLDWNAKQRREGKK